MRRFQRTRTLIASLLACALLAVAASLVTAMATGAPATGLTATFAKARDWVTGYQATYTITNSGRSAVHGWTVEFDLPSGARLDALWNGSYQAGRGHVTVHPLASDRTVAAGASVAFGMVVGHAPNVSALPANCRLNGRPCSPGSAPTPTPTSTSKTSAPPTPPTTSAPASSSGSGTSSAPPPANANTNCSIVVPAAPLTAAGLATPYQLVATDPAQGPCHEADPTQAAFVQAAVLDPATGAVSVYSPLVVDRGTKPAARPVTPRLPAGAVVAVWFGFNGGVLTLSGPGAGSCVGGLAGSSFGQFAYCNAAAFFTAANSAVAGGRLKVPPLGTASDGRPCPTVRDFAVVDQDQSDNLPTSYLSTAAGTVAQDTAANRAALGASAQPMTNGSDNRLLADLIDPALHCTPFTAPDLADPGARTTALALNELQAGLQAQPVALVPPNDPMTTVDGRPSLAKTNLYRAGTGQSQLPQSANLAAAARDYCTNLTTIAPKRLAADRAALAAAPSPDPASPNLLSFLRTRFTASIQLLQCRT